MALNRLQKAEEFFMNNLNKLPLGVDFTAGGLNQLQIIHSVFAPNSLRISSANFYSV
jgi:hypothetical protein